MDIRKNVQLPIAETRPIPQEAFDWYDEYAHGLIDRRTFISRLAGLSALGFSVATLTSALLPNYALAEQVSFNDPGIRAVYQDFSSPKGYGACRGYLVTPKSILDGKQKKAAAVLVVHENRGLNPYVKDVARRLAKSGYVAFAPDALHPVGGYPGNDDEGRALQRGMDRAKLENDFIAAAEFIKSHQYSSGKLGAVGFCFGGYIVNMLAATLGGELNAAVPFYGSPPAEEIRHQVKGPLMIHFAELDKRINASWPQYEQQLQANKAQYQAYTYQDANHGFHNDSTSRYSKKDAELAWQRSLNFFDEQLKS